MEFANAIASKAIVTGAGGFIGSAFAARLGLHRRLSLSGHGWREAIEAADFHGAIVVHLAARARDPGGEAVDFDRDNVEKTRVLAAAAAAGGAARFVFMSTIKVHGEETLGSAFHPDSPPAPASPYARSKWHAEEALRDIASRTAMELVILRIPLAYGPGVGGNFGALVRLADSRAWLPLGLIRNRRSLVHVSDVAEALVLAAGHARAPGRAFIASHPRPVSTTEMVTSLRGALGRSRRLVPVPASVLEAVSAVMGMRERVRRLTRSLEADSSALTGVLGWSPRMALEEGIVDTVAAWRKGADR